MAPDFVRYEEWIARTGMSLRATQESVARGDLLTHKIGRVVLIDYAAGVAWIRSHPAAELTQDIRPERNKRARTCEDVR